MVPQVRAGRLDDVPELTRIYNHYVRSSGATFDIEEQTPDARRAWLDQHAVTGPHRLLGYRLVGTWSEAGHKLGRWWDVRWYERPLGRGASVDG
jgi:phosphinothricin acetyltransferase